LSGVFLSEPGEGSDISWVVYSRTWCERTASGLTQPGTGGHNL
jgi:hypothetical protein